MEFELNKPLYKMDSKGKTRVWSINVGSKNQTPFYSVSHGQLDGKLQETEVSVPVGKSIGRANETTAEQQCLLEAEALYVKQIERKGYSEAIATERPNLPMLAHKYKGNEKKISWPAIGSIKVDGCLSGDTLIKTKEFNLKTIKYIVENKLNCSVLSYNLKTKKNEYKKVINYFKDRILSELIIWYEIETENGQVLKLTGNHRVFLPELNCWRRVDELTGEEKLMEI